MNARTLISEIESLPSIESLASYMQRHVAEWESRESQTYSVAAAGEAFALKAANGTRSVEACVFRQIQDNTSDTYFASRLRAALERLIELSKGGKR
jgi:hypothetical protein